MTKAQSSHPDNGIWLCRIDHKIIDRDPDRYPADLLRSWKQQTEALLRFGLEGNGDSDAQPASMSNPESQTRAAWAVHFAQRCDKHYYDDITIALALRIAGTSEGFPMRERMLDVLLGAKPSADALAAFSAFYGPDMPSDLAMLLKATRSVAQLVRTEPVTRGASFRFYLEAIGRLVAHHLDTHPLLSDEKLRQVQALVQDLREWGLGQCVEPVAASSALQTNAPKKPTEDPADDNPDRAREALDRARRETTPSPSDSRLLGLGGGKVRGSRWL